MTNERKQAIVVGASSGAVEAVSVILNRLPVRFALPIMIVIHVPPDRPNALVDVFRTKCALDVREAEDKEEIQTGCVYLAPPDYHLLVEADRRLSLSSEEQVHYSRPSIDVLFETSADVYGPALVGVILTGANSDGASGLRRVWESGGTPLVQSPELAQASAMPAAALTACPAAQALGLEEIAEYLCKIGQADD